MRAGLFAGLVAAWGPDGHKTIAAIAALLNPDVEKKAEKILGQSMADAANWPDEVRHESGMQWSAPLHFVNVPDGTCNFEYTRDCKEDQCAVGAILNFTAATEKGDADALKFVIHFVGDVHQPLHCAWTSDKGGNDIKVTEGFSSSNEHDNLHAVWDSGMIRKMLDDDGNADYNKLAQELLPMAQNSTFTACVSHSHDLRDSLKTCISKMASESVADACTYAYRDEHNNLIKNDDTIDMDYYKSRIQVVRERLAQAGARLAALLAKHLPDDPHPPSPTPGPGPSPSPSPGASCSAMGCHYKPGSACQCNRECNYHHDCCSDYNSTCSDSRSILV
jgi:hypothetical protein